MGGSHEKKSLRIQNSGARFTPVYRWREREGVEPTAPTEWAEPTHLEFVRGYHTPYRLVLLNPVV